MSTLVITSLNPYSNMEYQLRCFNGWKDIGYEITSQNSDAEYELLVKHGLQDKLLSRIPIGDTAEHLFGKPVPRILPLLERAQQSDHDYYILTNSDIFPAHRKVISGFLGKSFKSVAFTRTESFDLDLSRFNRQLHYRGGLDLFWFTKSGLQEALYKLNSTLVAERMTFGVPGWDYFLGHLLCRQLGAPLIDGTVFLHRSHKITYGDIDELGYYAGEMNKSGLYVSQDPTLLAQEFSNFIEQQCENGRFFSRLLKLMFYRQPETHKTPDYIDPSMSNDHQEVIEKFFHYLSDSNSTCAFSDAEIEVFVKRQCNDKDWATAINLLCHRDSRFSNRMRHVQLFLLSLLCTDYINQKTLTLIYPEGSMHAAALRQIITTEPVQNQGLSIFNLFAAELITYGIVNLNLMKYLYTVMVHPGERALFAIIISIAKRGLRNA